MCNGQDRGKRLNRIIRILFVFVGIFGVKCYTQLLVYMILPLLQDPPLLESSLFIPPSTSLESVESY